MPFLKSSASSSYQEKEKIRLNIVIIFLVALALVVSAIFILPNLAPNVTLTVPDVASIVFDGGVISLDADLTKVYVKVMYSDGTSKQVALSEMVSSGLDTTKEGKQNVSINFGGFVQNIDIEVVATDCLLTYVASVGGSIIGETTQRVPAGGNATTVIAVPEVGYKFVGWGDGYPDATRQDKSVSIDDEIKANFKKLEYTVIFYYPDGTTAREVLVQYNSYADAPRTDSKEMQKYGYKFVKWSEDFSKITKDTKIYPIYEKFATDIDFTFGLGIDGNPLGTSTNLKPYYAKGEIGSITVTPNTYRKFDSWSILNYEKKWIKIMPKTPSGDTVEVVTGELITFSSKIAEGKLEEEGIYTLSFVPKSTVDKITIVANFVYETSDIIFSSFDRIEATIPLKLGTAIGEHILLVPKAVTGYTFKYWYAKNGGMQDGKPIPVKETDLFTKPTEIIAYWTKDIQTAVFLKGETDGNLNEFTNNPTYDEQSGGIKLSVYFQDSLGSAISGKFPSFLPIKKLYDFAGWYLANADGVISQTVIDNNYKVVDKITYIAPKFVVKNRTVDVKFSGAGEIKYGLENGDLSVLNNFKFNIDADKSYKFQATEAQGYMIGKISYKVGEEINTSTSNEFVIAKLDIDASNITNIEINVSFVIKEYNLTINNGTVGAAKGMIYDDGKLLNFGDSNSITIKISHNVSKHINIMAPEGYYINSVLVNSSEKIIPEKASNFTLPLQNMMAETTISIAYEKFNFIITAPPSDVTQDGVLVGRIELDSPSNPDGSFNSTDTPKLKVDALSGYYIRYLLINGVMVDPYSQVSEYTINSYKVNNIEPNRHLRAAKGEISKDNRFTNIELTFEGLANSKDIKVVFEKLYYFVDVSADINCTVSANRFQVLYGTTLNIAVATTSNRYIYSYTIDNIETTFPESLVAQEIVISGIVSDKKINIASKSFVKAITIEGKNNAKATFEYKNETGNPIKSGLGTSVERNINSNNDFTISADKGYHLISIIVKKSSSEGNIISETVKLPYNSESYVLSINNLSSNVTVEVETAENTYGIAVYLSNGGDSSYNAPASLNYGESGEVAITIGSGKTIMGITVNGNAYNYTTNSSGKAIVAINDIDRNYEVVVRFKDSTASDENAIVFSFDNNFGEVIAYLKGDLNKTPITTWISGQSIVFVITPKEGYQLKFFGINNKSDYIIGENKEVTVVVNEKPYVTAIFATAEYRFTSDGSSGKGYVNADKETFTYKQSGGINIKMIPQNGYHIAGVNFTIGQKISEELTTDQIDELIVKNDYTYALVAEKLVNNVVCKVTFAPNKYEISVIASGEGQVVSEIAGTSANYGDVLNFKLSSLTNNFIQSVVINGVSFNLYQMTDTTFDSNIQQFTHGTVSFGIVGESTIEITFAPNVFRVYVADSEYGQTLSREDGGTYAENRNLNVKAGSIVHINMKAAFGYHVSSLEINGIIINEIDWKQDHTNPNNNKDNYYKIVNISENYNIRVRYAINTYQINFSEINESINFKAYETDYRQFGSIKIYGYDRLQNYAIGLVHGAPIKIVVSPVTSKGYYVYSFKVIYTKNNTATGDERVEIDYTKNISANGGEIIFSEVLSDNIEVRAEFKRRVYDCPPSLQIFVDNKSSTFPINHTTQITYKNPYSAEAKVVSIDNKYEYGIQYEVTANPGVGYFVNSLTVGSSNTVAGEERKQYIRNDIYKSSIIDNTYIGIYYTIKEYDIKVGFNQVGGKLSVYSEGKKLLIDTNGSIKVTHNTTLTYVMTPKYAAAGYYNASLNIDGSDITITKIDSDFSYEKVVTKSFDVKANFIIHTYRISFAEIAEGARATATPDRVKWGESSTLRLLLEKGYIVNYFFVDEVRHQASELINNAFNLENIKKDTIISFGIERNPQQTKFDNDINSKNGSIYVKLNGLERMKQESTLLNMRYSDAMVFYFEPKIGYLISEINIIMNDENGISTTYVSRVSQLTTDGTNRDYKSYAFNKVTGNITVKVTYTLKNYSVTSTINGGNGKFTTLPPSKLDYNNKLIFKLQAQENYNLKSLVINGIDYIGSLTKSSSSNLSYYIDANYCYCYNFDKLASEVQNNRDDIQIAVTFAINKYRVAFYVNGDSTLSETYDQPLRISLANNQIIQNVEAEIKQTRSEGYRVTSITLFYGNSSEGNATILNSYLNADYIKINAALTDNGRPIYNQLDYHDTNKNYLVIKYTTEIITYDSSMDIKRYESGASQDDGFEKLFSVEKKFNSPDGVPMVGDQYKHFTTAAYTVRILSGVSNYEFDGFYEKIDGKWVKAENGVNGITITLKNNEYTLGYEIKADREFIAAIYKIYEVNLYIYPEFKWINGEYLASNFNMSFRQYASIKAKVFNSDVNNFTSGSVPKYTQMDLSNLNTEADAYGHYTFRVRAFAKLALKGVDAIVGANASQGTEYYIVDRNGNVPNAKDTELGTESGKEMHNNTNAYIYFKNVIKLSMDIESVGGKDVGEGGSGAYVVDGRNVNTTNNSLNVNANSKVNITFEAKINYKIQGIYVKQTLGVDNNGGLIFGEEWILIDSAEIQFLKAIFTQDNSNNNVKCVINISSVTKSVIFKAKFIKMITFSTKVECFTDESNKNFNNIPTLGAKMTPNGKYEYGTAIVFDAVINNSAFNGKWKFVGFMINGVNEYRYLMESYILPNDGENNYTQNYFLSQYSIENLQGIELNGIYNVEIVAKYVPIYEIEVSNEYALDTENAFDKIGEIYVNAIAYNDAKVVYDKNRTQIANKNETTSLKVMGKINASSISGYDTWTNNTVELKYLSIVAVGGEIVDLGFEFKYWEYYDEAQSQYVQIPGSNRDTPTFNFALGVLYGKENGEGKIRIRANIQKIQTVKITKKLYYNSRNDNDLPPDSAKNDNAPTIGGQILAQRTYNYGESTAIVDGTWATYEFIGWVINGNVRTENSINLTLDKDYNVVAKYIKKWTVKIEVKNNSGSQITSDSSPNITIMSSNTSKVSVGALNNRLATLNVLAGDEFSFGLYTDGTKFDAKYDKFVIMTTKTSTSTKTSTEPPILEKAGRTAYPLTVGDDIVITIEYKTLGELCITNMIEGSTLVFYGEFAKIISNTTSATTATITDGGKGDADGSVNGSITVVAIPMSQYNEKIAISLPGLAGVVIQPNANAIFNFSGDSTAYQRLITRGYYGSPSVSNIAEKPFESGNGSAGNPFMISTGSQFKYIDNIYVSNSSSVNNIYFKLKNNINIASIKSICVGSGFDGIFDGGGFTVSGISAIDDGQATNYAMFSSVNKGTIKNLKIGASTISVTRLVEGGNYGFIANKAVDSTFDGITILSGSNITISGTHKNLSLGGIVGNATSCSFNSCTIDNIVLNVSSIKDEAANCGIGGVVGIMTNSKIANTSVINPRVTLQNKMNGGGIVGTIIGSKDGVSLDNCSLSNGGYYKADGAGSNIGGIVGLMQNNGTIRNTIISSGQMEFRAEERQTPFSNVGGLVGRSKDSLIDVVTVGTGSIGFNLTTGVNMFGAIVGKNDLGSTIQKVTIANTQISHKIPSTEVVYIGGIVGNNLGAVNDCTINMANSSADRTYTSTFIRAVFDDGNFSDADFDREEGSNNNTNAAEMRGVAPETYYGGLVGRNENDGRIGYKVKTNDRVGTNNFSGKIMLNDKFAPSNMGTNIYMGGLTGYTSTGYAVGNITNSALVSFHLIAVDNQPVGTAQTINIFQRIVGTYAGNPLSNDSTASGNSLYAEIIAKGSKKTDGYVAYKFPSYVAHDAKDFRDTNVMLAQSPNGNHAVSLKDKILPYSGTSYQFTVQTLWYKAYDYSGKLRVVKITTKL